MNYRFKLDPSSRKFVCPKCGKKRLVKFIDNSHEYLDSDFGRCDRISSCGYFNTPERQMNEISRDNDFFPRLEKPKPISYINKVIVDASLGHYSKNGLHLFLVQHYGEAAVNEVFARYKVGTSNEWGGSTVFWQIDAQGNVRSGKVMKYSETTGRRVKKPEALITWVHKLLKLQDFNLRQVLFGEHLLRNISEDSNVCVVESEKTAIICAIMWPEFIWLATGSFHMLKADALTSLKGRNVVLFPDTDTHTQWTSKAHDISIELKTKLHVSELLLNLMITSNYGEGFDLADYLLKRDRRRFESSTIKHTTQAENNVHVSTPAEPLPTSQVLLTKQINADETINCQEEVLAWLPAGWLKVDGMVINQYGYPANWDEPTSDQERLALMVDSNPMLLNLIDALHLKLRPTYQ